MPSVRDSIRNGIGWLGSVLFAVCAVPQVITTWTTHDVSSMSVLFVLMWFLGEVFSAVYLVWDDIKTGIRHYPIYFNYTLNTICVTYLLYARLTY